METSTIKPASDNILDLSRQIEAIDALENAHRDLALQSDNPEMSERMAAIRRQNIALQTSFNDGGKQMAESLAFFKDGLYNMGAGAAQMAGASFQGAALQAKAFGVMLAESPLGVAAVQKVEQATDFVFGAGKALSETADNVYARMSSFFESTSNRLMNFGAMVLSIPSKIKEKALETGKEMSEVAESVFDAAGARIKTGYNTAMDVAAGVGFIGKAGMDFAGKKIDEGVGAVKAKGAEIADAVEQRVEAVASKLGEGVETVKAKGAELLDEAGDVIAGVSNIGKEGMKSAAMIARTMTSSLSSMYQKGVMERRAALAAESEEPTMSAPKGPKA